MILKAGRELIFCPKIFTFSCFSVEYSKINLIFVCDPVILSFILSTIAICTYKKNLFRGLKYENSSGTTSVIEWFDYTVLSFFNVNLIVNKSTDNGKTPANFFIYIYIYINK